MMKLCNLGLGLIAASALMACSVERSESEDPAGYYFEGWVYDGVTNQRVVDYTMTLSYWNTVRQAEVDATTGRYMVGPLKPDSDYTIEIVANGYREFYSSNTLQNGLPVANDNIQSQLFEAFLFPTNVPSPAITFTFFTPDADPPQPTTGRVRVTPNFDNGISAISLDGAIAPSVAGQQWVNDADRKFSTRDMPIENGAVTFAAGDLVYGVTYRATVYLTDGYQYQDFVFTSGLTDDQAVTLQRLDEQLLGVTSDSRNEGLLSDNATVVLTFNLPIELAPDVSAGVVAEAIDDGFSIVSPDSDGDAALNILTLTDAAGTQETGTSLQIDGNQLTLSWAREPSNFEETDGDDPILSASYDISSITLRPVGGRTDQEVDLSTLLGTNTITVRVDPQ